MAVILFIFLYISFFLGVLAEARFYGIEGAIDILTAMADEKELQRSGLVSFTRKDVLKAIMSTPTTSELRFQGVNFVGADLSKLDLRNINFKVIELLWCYNNKLSLCK